MFRLDDKSGTIEASADENLLNLHRDTLKDDELAKDGLMQFPTVIGGVVPVINVKGIKSPLLKKMIEEIRNS